MRIFLREISVDGGNDRSAAHGKPKITRGGVVISPSAGSVVYTPQSSAVHKKFQHPSPIIRNPRKRTAAAHWKMLVRMDPRQSPRTKSRTQIATKTDGDAYHNARNARPAQPAGNRSLQYTSLPIPLSHKQLAHHAEPTLHQVAQRVPLHLPADDEVWIMTGKDAHQGHEDLRLAAYF